MPARQHVLRPSVISFLTGVYEAPRPASHRSRAREGPCMCADERACLEGSLTASRRPKKGEDTSRIARSPSKQLHVATSQLPRGTVSPRTVDLQRRRGKQSADD